jgi:hypothetical protein
MFITHLLPVSGGFLSLHQARCNPPMPAIVIGRRLSATRTLGTTLDLNHLLGWVGGQFQLTVKTPNAASRDPPAR